MKLKTVGCALVLASVAMSVQAGEGEGKHGNPKPLKGCYQVVRGSLEESPAEDKEVVGTYQLVLEQDGPGRGKRKHAVISGPMFGHEDLAGHEEGDEGEGEESHGKHAFGSYDRGGVIIAHETSAQVTGFDCFDPVTGAPRLIYGNETIEFERGTGAYSGLIGGEIVFTGALDRCTDPSNPVTSFNEVSGELCFLE